MYKRALIPLDGSRLAEGILPFILQIAGPLDLEVVLVRVVQPIMPQATEGTTYFKVDDVAARLNEAREYLAPVAADLRRQGVRVTTDARHGFGRLLFGSVAEAVLRPVEIPVLMMRLTECQASAAETA